MRAMSKAFTICRSTAAALGEGLAKTYAAAFGDKLDVATPAWLKAYLRMVLPLRGAMSIRMGASARLFFVAPTTVIN